MSAQASATMAKRWTNGISSPRGLCGGRADGMKIDLVEVKTPLRRLRHGQCAQVNRIERAAKKRDARRAGGRPRADGLACRAQRSSAGCEPQRSAGRFGAYCRRLVRVRVSLCQSRSPLGAGRLASSLVERVGHGAHQLRNSFAGRRGNSVKFEATLPRKMRATLPAACDR